MYDRISNRSNINATNNSITAEDSRQLILKEDGKRISEDQKSGCLLSTHYSEINSKIYNSSWDIPKEEVYCFDTIYKEASEGGYFVGKKSKNVYAIPNQGDMSAYQIKNNKVVQTLKFKNTEKSYEWRK